MGCGKSSYKREVYRDKSLCQEQGRLKREGICVCVCVCVCVCIPSVISMYKYIIYIKYFKYIYLDILITDSCCTAENYTL